MKGQVPEVVRGAIVTVCRDAFHWKDDIRALFVGAGVPPAIYDRYNLPEASKSRIARHVLSDLTSAGPSGHMIQTKIVIELCRMDRAHPDAADQAKGARALAELKRLATTERVIVDVEEARTLRRREEAKRQQEVHQMRQRQLGTLRDTFMSLLNMKPRTLSDRQRRGYDLEALLADLFEAYEIEYRKTYRALHEAFDGSFHFRGFTYLVEAKWEALPPAFDDLAKFKFKVDGKLESTRGLFVAMAGFDAQVLDHLFRTATGSRNNLILMDALDLVTVFDGRMSLTDALIAKIDAAEQEGKPWYALGR